MGVAWGAASWAIGRRSGPGLERAGAGVLVAGLVIALALGVASADRIADTVERQYDAFVHLDAQPQGEAAGSRLASGAGNRYDYWRVAWDSWKDAPVRGVGAGNYDREYFAARTTTEDIRQPHSIELHLLSELGLVGLALLIVALAGIALGAFRTIATARRSRGARTIAVASIGVVVAWFVHTSVDWLHLLPGVTAIALVAAVCLVRQTEDVATAGARTRWRWIPVLGVALVIAFAALTLSRQALSNHFVSQARAAVPDDPATALREADRALRIDPELMGAYYAKSAALARFNEPDAAKAALREAARREPRNFVTWALLGDLAARTGNFGQARGLYRRALALNPRDPSLVDLARDPRSAVP